MRYQKLQRITDRQISSKVKEFEQLHRDIETMLADALNDKILADRGNGETLRKNIAKRVDEFKKTVRYKHIGKEELKDLHNNRVDRFKANNIPKVEKFERLPNAMLAAEQDVLDKVDALVNRVVSVYNNNIIEFQWEQSKEFAKQVFIEETTVNEAQQIARVVGRNDVIDRFVKEDYVMYFYEGNGRKMRAEYWLDRHLRTAFAKESTNAVRNDAKSYGYDLVRISAHSDCSNLCEEYQGEIYSLSGESDEYEAFDDILWGSGGSYKHPNCRHHESIYIEGASDNELYDRITGMSDSDIEENYERRQQGMYYRRQETRWNDRVYKSQQIGASKSEIAYAKAKRAQYNRLKKSYGVN